MMYAVSVLFHFSPHNSPSTHRLWEERILLIYSESEEDARAIAEALAKEEEFEYEAATGEPLIFRYECIESVKEVDEPLVNGSEVFTRYLRDSEARSMLQPFDDDPFTS
jgi:hypothetical protein